MVTEYELEENEFVYHCEYCLSEYDDYNSAFQCEKNCKRARGG